MIVFIDDYESCGTIGVCADCLHSDANGEYSPDRPADLPEPWSAIPFGYLALSGGEHSDSCDEETRESDGCDCDDRGFTQSSCDGCGDHHHGDRFAYTLFRATLPYARREHVRALESVRTIRNAPVGRYPAGMLFRELSIAADWRTYAVRLHREERQHAAWVARMRAERAAA